MTIKTLLLGSAAAVAVVGGAQAADLSVAEPVEYVKVCDYFGTGYWYIPGTDTCIKIGGHVQLTADFGTDAIVATQYINSSSYYHDSTWTFSSEEEVNFDVKSETEYGVLEAYASFQGKSSDGAGPSGISDIVNDGYFVSLGGFKAGYFSPSFEQAGLGNGSFMDSFGMAFDIQPIAGASKLQTVQMSWAAGGLTAAVAVSDPVGSSAWWYASDSAPLVSGSISTSQKNFSLGIGGGFLDTYAGSEWGVVAQADITVGPSDMLWLEGSYGSNLFTGTDGLFGNSYGENSGYVLEGSWRHTLSKTLRFDVDLAYAKDADDSHTLTQGGVDLVWMPVAGFSAKAAIGYKDPSNASGSWEAELGVRRDW